MADLTSTHHNQRLRDVGTIGDDVLRRLEHELDLTETRLKSRY